MYFLSLYILNSFFVQKIFSFELQQGNENQYCASREGQLCKFCYMSYLNNDYQCKQPNQYVENCLIYKDHKTCEQCQYGYRLFYQKCLEIKIKNCLQENHGVCLKCINDMPVNFLGQCLETEKCQDIHCQFCFEHNNKQQKCQICKKNYVLNTKYYNYPEQCVQEKIFQKNCQKYDRDLQKCEQCKLNYYMTENGSCLKSEAYQVQDFAEHTYTIITKILLFFMII